MTTDAAIVRIDATGIDNPLIGKHVSRDKFERCLPAGINVNDFALNMDLAGTPQLGWWAGWRGHGLIDIYLQPDVTTLTPMPGVPDMAWCLGRFTDVGGTPIPVCPRSLLERQVQQLAHAGYEARCAFEIEFFLFDERVDAIRRKRYHGLNPVGGPSPKLGYMTQKAPEFRPFLANVAAALDEVGIPWEAFTDEAAPGQFELNIAPADPVTAADRAVRAKQVLREVAYANGLTVTFMPRPFADLPYGSGLHVHLSLQRDNSPAFVDATTQQPTPVMRHWIGGWLATVAGATSLLTPTVNSFRRQVDFVAAPTTPTWGEENKAAAIRTITRSASLGRVEHRVAAADANPYLVLATLIAGGLAGIDESIDPPPEVVGLPWGLPADRPRLPHSLTTAAEALAADERLTKPLGDEFVEHWIESRKWEWLMFHTTGGDPDATGATDWELTRYFEWV